MVIISASLAAWWKKRINTYETSKIGRSIHLQAIWPISTHVSLNICIILYIIYILCIVTIKNIFNMRLFSVGFVRSFGRWNKGIITGITSFFGFLMDSAVLSLDLQPWYKLYYNQLLIQQNWLYYTWLVVSNMAFIFHFIYGLILPIEFHIFQRGWNHQPDTPFKPISPISH